MVGTALGGRPTVADAGPAEIVISPQHDFIAEDIRFDGPAGATVSEIRFGDNTVWSGDNVAISFLTKDSFLKDMLTGNRLKGGFDIRIKLAFSQAGTVQALLKGKKPVNCA